MHRTYVITRPNAIDKIVSTITVSDTGVVACILHDKPMDISRKQAALILWDIWGLHSKNLRVKKIEL